MIECPNCPFMMEQGQECPNCGHDDDPDLYCECDACEADRALWEKLT